MATFELTGPDGGTYHVDAPDEHAAIAAFSAFHGIKSPEAAPPVPDKYQQAAADEQDLLKSKGIDEGAGFTRRLAHGYTLGADTTVLAGLETPLEMIKRGTINPVEGYNYAKAREDRIMGDARKNTGLLGTATESLGAATSGAGLAKAGYTAASLLPEGAGFLARAGAGAADAAALGGVSGAMEGNGLKERATNAAIGTTVGFGVGATVPGLVAAVKFLSAPITSQIAARIDPKLYAQSQVARAISEGKMTAADVELALLHAQNEGQGVFTVADALGNPGQRMLSTVARSPGEGRTAVGDAMEQRQAGQGRRVVNALSEGFEAPRTAAQTRETMTAARNTAADAEYGAVRDNADATNARVDVVPTINNLDRNIGTQPAQALQVPNDSVESVLRPYRERLARVNPDDFSAIERIRGDMADAAKAAGQQGHGNRARLIGQAVRELDAGMESASPGYRRANANFRQRSQDIEAIDAGRQAALRGRTEDTIPAFQGQSQAGQRAFRTGYVDPLIESVQGPPSGVNKARQFTGDAFKDEAAAIAPGNDTMQRRLSREMTMFETRNTALGGSKTADNLNDDAAMAVSPEVMGVVKHVISGNFGGAVSASLAAGKNALTGNTAAVRKEVADILLMDGKRFTNGRLQAMVDSVMNRARRANEIADSIRQGAVSGGVVTGPGQNRR